MRTTTTRMTHGVGFDVEQRQHAANPLPVPATENDFDRSQYYCQVFQSVLVHPEVAVPQPLTLFLPLHHEGQRWAAQLIDATARGVVHFEGDAAHPYGETQAVITDWKTTTSTPPRARSTTSFGPYPRRDLSGTSSTPAPVRGRRRSS